MKNFIMFGAMALCCFSGCGSYEVVDKSKYAVVEKQELEQLKKSADVAKGIGRYQLHIEGIRMWRLDTATGKLCIWLSSEYDWKDPRTRSSSCN